MSLWNPRPTPIPEPAPDWLTPAQRRRYRAAADEVMDLTPDQGEPESAGYRKACAVLDAVERNLPESPGARAAREGRSR